MKKEKVVTNGKNTDEFIDKANGFIGNRIRDMNMKHRYFKLKEKVKNGKKDEKVCMTKKAFKKEHKNLLKVLKKKDPKKLDAEAKEQKEEMKKYGMQESIQTTGLHTVKLTPRKERKTKGIQNFWSGSKAQAFRDNIVNSDNEVTKNKQRRGMVLSAGGFEDNARFRRKQRKAKGMKKVKESSSPLRAVKLVIRESNLKEKTAGEIDMQSNALKAKIKNSNMPMHKKWNKLTKVASATVSSKKKATDEKRTSSAKAFKMLSNKLLNRKA